MMAGRQPQLLSVQEFGAKYGHHAAAAGAGPVVGEDEVVLEGRVVSSRSHGKVKFATIEESGHQTQLFIEQIGMSLLVHMSTALTFPNVRHATPVR